MLCPPPEPVVDAAWLVASVAAEQVDIVDWDLAAASAVAASPEQDALRGARDAAIIPYSVYRPGQFRRPLALVRGGIPGDRLAMIPSPDGDNCEENERAHARQLHRLLRAMIGAPAAAPLPALVAAAIARGRAAPVMSLQDGGRTLHLYRLDSGPAYFAFDAVLGTLVGGEPADTLSG
ncbi:MAG: hypothetical protein U0822_03570 [Anaerolineae bacterium]